MHRPPFMRRGKKNSQYQLLGVILVLGGLVILGMLLSSRVVLTVLALIMIGGGIALLAQ